MSPDSERGGAAGTGIPAAPGAAPLTADPVAPGADTPPVPLTGQTVSELTAFIVAEAGRPIDMWAIAALLESVGIRDRDAVERFGHRDVFALAQAVQVRLPPLEPTSGGAVELTRRPLPERLRRGARLLTRGTFFFVPLSLQLFTLLAFGISQFAYIHFSTFDSSLVAAATGLAFAVTGGFIQALGFLGPLYQEPGKYMLTRRVVVAVLLAGIATAVAVGLVVWALSAITGAYPPGAIRVVLSYYVLISVQSLINAALYMLRRYALLVASTAFGLVVVVLLHRQTSLTVQQAHWVGLGVLIAAQLALAFWLLARNADRTRGAMRLAHLPRVRLVLRRAAPFWAYGTLYFCFLIADRMMAWAAGSNPLPLWFRTPYELGLDWALFGVVVALAFLEVIVEDFSERIFPWTDQYRVNAVRDHNRAVGRFWAWRVAFTGMLAAAGTCVAIIIAWALHRAHLLGPAAKLYSDRATHVVFAGGIMGYTLLALGIANSVFVMSLGRPWRVLVALAPAVVVSVAVGATLTTFSSYWNAVWGMVAGAAVFALISGVETSRALREADYLGYSAF